MRPSALLLLFVLAPRPAAAAPSADFAVDPRVELVSALHMLVDQEEFRARFAVTLPDYASEAALHFGGHSTHPAVARLGTWVGRSPQLPLELALRLGDPPALEQRSPLPEPLAAKAGGPAEVEAFLKELRDFARVSGFARFYSDHRKLYGELAAAAKKEAGPGPAPAAAYTGLAGPARVRYLLAPLLAPQLTATLEQGGTLLWVRHGSYSPEGAAGFGFDRPEGSAGRDWVHAATERLMDPFAKAFFAYKERPPEGCPESWSHCLREQVAAAVALRLMTAEGKGREYEEALLFAAERYPQLKALAEALARFEAGKRGTGAFAAFFPELVAVFQKTLPALPPAAASAPPSAPMPANPDNAAGLAAFAAGDHAGALASFRSAMAAVPLDPAPHNNCGAVNAALKDYAAALTCYDKALELAGAPSGAAAYLLPEILSSRASALEGLGRKDEAAKDLERALKEAGEGWTRKDEARGRLAKLKG